MIMRYYFGSHTIHIIREQPEPVRTRGSGMVSPVRLDHRVCVIDSDDSKRPPQPDDVEQEPPSEDQVRYEQLHYDCNLEDRREGGSASSISRQLDVQLLFVNKQIYQEASEILYGIHTFVFTSPNDLAKFCHSMAKAQKRTLRKVQLVTDAFLSYHDDAPEKYRHDCFDHPWPEAVLPALTSLTDLDLIIRIQVGDDDPSGDRVAAGPVRALHTLVRWHFGYLRRLNNLQNVVVNIHNPDDLVDPEYLSVMNAAFAAELVSPFRLQLIQAEEEEVSWRAEVEDHIHTLSTNADERISLTRDLKRYQGHHSKAEHNVQQQSRAIERLRLRSKEPSERQKEKLTHEQATLDHADANVKAARDVLVAAQAFDRGALEGKMDALLGKIAAREENVFRYVREFEEGRGGRKSSNS